MTDSLRPMALDAMRAGEQHKGRPSSDRSPRGRASFVLWFFGAAVFSFSTMAALERHGLSQLLMPAAPPPAEVSVIEEPIAFSAIRHARVLEDVLASPWRHREHDAAPATPTATSASAAVATTATKKTETVSASPPPAIVAPKREASSKPVAPARTASAPVAPPANAASASGSDEVAAAAAMLEKAKGEHALE